MFPLFRLKRLEVFYRVLQLEIDFQLDQPFLQLLPWRIHALGEVYLATSEWNFDLDGIILRTPPGASCELGYLEAVAKEIADAYPGGCAVELPSLAAESAPRWKIWVSQGKERWRVLDRQVEVEKVAWALLMR